MGPRRNRDRSKETPPRPRRPNEILDQSNLRFAPRKGGVPVMRAATRHTHRSGDQRNQVTEDLGGAVSGARECVGGRSDDHATGRTEEAAPCTRSRSVTAAAPLAPQTAEHPEADPLPSQHPGSPASEAPIVHGESASPAHALTGNPAASAKRRNPARNRRSFSIGIGMQRLSVPGHIHQSISSPTSDRRRSFMEQANRARFSRNALLTTEFVTCLLLLPSQSILAVLPLLR